MKILDQLKANWGAIVFVTLLNVAIVWYGTSTKDTRQQLIKADAARQEAFGQRAQARVAEWATVIKEKELAPGEKLRLVDVPDQTFGFLSTRCMIYTNAEYHTAQFICPGTAEVSQ